MKKVYWGYAMKDKPKVGSTISLTRIEVEGFSLGFCLNKKHIETTGTINSIQRIAENMSILWTEDCGYAVYYTE